jgi:integrase
MTFGTYPAISVAKAYKLNSDAIIELGKGNDPGAALVDERKESRTAITLKSFVDEYIEKWAQPRKRSWREDERMLKKDVTPLLGRYLMRDIERRQIIKLLDRVADRAPIAANRTYAVIRRMFNFAIERDVIAVSPCTNIRTPTPERQRNRILSADEIKILWENLDVAPMDKATRIAIRLLLVTAQRRGELVSARWSNIDLVNGWWTIPADASKNYLPHRVPLTKLACNLLEQAKAIAPESEYVFPSPTRDTHINPDAINRAVNRNRLEIGIEHFTLHDLRRTAASQMTSAGIPRLTVSKVLNHAESGITAVYDRHSYDQEKRQALDCWASSIERIIEPDNYNVVKINAK